VAVKMLAVQTPAAHDALRTKAMFSIALLLQQQQQIWSLARRSMPAPGGGSKLL
jgi:hypothetical protein